MKKFFLLRENKISVFEYPSYGIKDFFRKIKYAYQRARYGFCERDIYNLDHYLSNVIKNSIEYLAKNHNGYPTSYANKYSNDDVANRKWTEDLKTIANCFHYAQEDNVTPKFWDMYYKTIIKKEKSKEKSEWPQDQYDEEVRKETERTKFIEHNKNKGFDLLKKNFFNLWD